MRSLVGHLSVGLLAVALASGAAYAQDEEFEEEADGDEVGEVGDGDGATAPPPPGEEAGSSGYPQEIIARPLTLPKGAWEGSVLLLTNEGFDATLGAVAFGYGVSDKLTLGASYAFAIDPSEFKGPIDLFALFSFMTTSQMEAVATGSVGYDLLAEGLTPLTAGVLVQYNLNDKMAVITPGNQLTITLEGDVKPIFLDLPVALGYQVNNQIYAEVGTNIATIEIADADSGFIFADFIPLSVTGFFSPDNKLDVGLSLSTELKDNAFDPLFIGLVARYRGGIGGHVHPHRPAPGM